jgi:hypothetical protein
MHHLHDGQPAVPIAEAREVTADRARAYYHPGHRFSHA